MSPKLPSPERLLGDMLRHKPYTREGQWMCARRVEELVRECNLGSAEVFSYTENKDGQGPDYPLVKILSSFGPERSGHTRETMTWLGHLDTVDPQPDERSGDSFIIEEVSKDTNGNRSHLAGKQIGKRRGTLDMWSGNLAYLYALQKLRDSGRSEVVIQTILSSREELGSEVLHQAIEDGTVEKAKIGATTEILVGDTGKPSPLYRGRTGRIGIDIITRGEAPHSGEIARYPEKRRLTADRHEARLIDEILDDERGFSIENSYPDDKEGILPNKSILISGRGEEIVHGLSQVGLKKKHFDLFNNDPNLDVAILQSRVRQYLEETFEAIAQEIGRLPYEVRQEKRGDVPFTDPWVTPADHSLVHVASAAANEIRGTEVLVERGNGVAEEGMLFHRLGTKMIGWSPDGHGAHEKEWVVMDSIEERAEWLKKMAQFEGKWE